MKILALSTLFALAAFTSSCASSRGTASAPSEEMTKAMEANWTAYMTPGSPHQTLNDRVGRWSLVVKQFTPGVAEPMTSNATSEVKWILDGRFLQDMTSGSAMGMTFNGIGTLGYDNMKQKYVSTWADNMGTGVMTSEGTYDAATKTWSYTTRMPDFFEGKYVDARSTERMIDRDHWVMQCFAPGPDGGEYLCMEIAYTRS
jgi:hypothetical protein